MEECDDSKHDDILLSLDGVHPNKKLYRKWAELVGRKLYVRIHRQKGLMEQGKQQLI
jgi:lysophospholipase L1-like esterase